MNYILGILILMTSGVAFAAPDQSSGGLPQMDPTTFSSQIFWLFASFALLYVLMSRVALPKVGRILEERRTKISEDLTQAKALKEEADALYQSHEDELKKSHEKANDLITKLNNEIADKARVVQESLENDLKEQSLKSEMAIEEAKEKALKSVDAVAASIVVDLAAKLNDVAINDNDASKAVKETFKKG